MNEKIRDYLSNLEMSDSGIRMVDNDTYSFEIDFFSYQGDDEPYLEVGRFDVLMPLKRTEVIRGIWEYDDNDPEEIEDFKKRTPENGMIELFLQHVPYIKRWVFNNQILTRELARINRDDLVEIKNAKFIETEFREYVEFYLKHSGLKFTLYLEKETVKESLYVHASNFGSEIDLEFYGLKNWDTIRENLFNHQNIRLRLLGKKDA